MLGDPRKYEESLKPINQDMHAELEKAGQQPLPMDMPKATNPDEAVASAMSAARKTANFTDAEGKMADLLMTYLLLFQLKMVLAPKDDRAGFDKVIETLTIEYEAKLIKKHREIVNAAVAKAVNGDRLPNAGSFGVA